MSKMVRSRKKREKEEGRATMSCSVNIDEGSSSGVRMRR